MKEAMKKYLLRLTQPVWLAIQMEAERDKTTAAAWIRDTVEREVIRREMERRRKRR
jgi:hypothetical protein